jgi:hypothetical protein
MRPLLIAAALVFMAMPAFAEEKAAAAPAPEPAPAAAPTPTSAPAPKAETPAAPAAAAPAAVSDPGASEARVSKMRDRWRKMTPKQKEEMRQKADRRLQERYERLSPQEQAQINTLIAEAEKLNKEQRSIFLAQIHEKAYKERQQKKLMKDEETKPVADPTAAAPAAASPTSPVEKQ